MYKVLRGLPKQHRRQCQKVLILRGRQGRRDLVFSDEVAEKSGTGGQGVSRWWFETLFLFTPIWGDRMVQWD